MKETPNVPTYWLTRDKKEGMLSPEVEVWVSKPHRARFDDGDCMWLPDIESVDAYFATWTTAESMQTVHVYPETELECIRVGV